MFIKTSNLFNEMAEIPDAGGSDDASLMSALQQHADSPGGQVQQPVEEKPAVEAPKEEKPEAKSLTDKLGAVEEAPEEKEEEAKPADDEPPTYKGRVPTDKERSTWTGLKKTAAEYETFKTKYAELEKKVQELEKSPISEEVRQKLERAEQIQAAYDMRNSPEFMQAVTEPKNAVASDVAEIASTFGLNEGKLWQAFQERNEWKRNIAIEKAAQESEQEISGGVVAALQKNADRMHSIWKKESELESKATDLKAALDLRSKDTQQKQTLEQEQAWNKAADETRQMLETKLAPIFKGMAEDEKAAVIESLKTAKISNSPSERALQAQAPHIAAVLIQKFNAQSKAMADLRKENAALLKARPGASNNQEPQKQVARSTAEEDEDFMAALATAEMPKFG